MVQIVEQKKISLESSTLDWTLIILFATVFKRDSSGSVDYRSFGNKQHNSLRARNENTPSEVQRFPKPPTVLQ